jgi:hypothetical protein
MHQETRREEIERLWALPESRKYWGGIPVIYYQPRDPRLIVPKSIPAMGWTINFAHPHAIRALLALLLVIPLTTGFTMGVCFWLGVSPFVSVALVLALVALAVIAICVISARMAKSFADSAKGITAA